MSVQICTFCLFIETFEAKYEPRQKEGQVVRNENRERLEGQAVGAGVERQQLTGFVWPGQWPRDCRIMQVQRQVRLDWLGPGWSYE